MSRPQRQQKDSAATQAVASAKMAEMLTVSSLVQELEKSRESLAAELKTYLSTSLDTSLAPIQASLDTIRTTLDSHTQKIATMESTLTTHSDELTERTTRLDQLEKANAALVSKTEDLENRSRRQNLRIVGLPEGVEGGSPLDFVSQLLHNVIGEDIFPKPPELDRAHRTPAPKPAQGQRSRDKERVLRWARSQKGDIKFKDNRILFFPDMSASLAKQRAAFQDIKVKLHNAGIMFALRHPARLCITVDGNKHHFDTADAAEAFYKQLKPSATATAGDY